MSAESNSRRPNWRLQATPKFPRSCVGQCISGLRTGVITLRDEAALIEPVLGKAGSPLEAFRPLDVPVLYMLGKRSTTSAHGVARLLTSALPRVDVVEFGKLGHMGPVTHPEPVNEAIARFLERH